MRAAERPDWWKMSEPLGFERGLELVRKGHVRPCLHRAVELEARERKALCRACGKTLDAFEVLLMYADRGARERRKAPDAERAAELVADLVRHGGRVSINRRGVQAFAKAGKREVRRSGRHGLADLWSAIVSACEEVEAAAKWIARGG